MVLGEARAMHKRLPVAVAGNFIGTCAAGLLFGSDASRPYLLCWIFSAGVHAVSSLCVWHSYRRRRVTHSESRMWLRYTVAISLTAGLLWAWGWLLLFPNGPARDRQTWFLLWSTGLLDVGGGLVLSCCYEALLLFITPYSALAVLLLTVQRTAAPMALVDTCWLFTVTVLAFAWQLHQAFRKSERLHYKNVALSRQLSAQANSSGSDNQARARCLAAAGHELRQPLHALKLYLATLSTEKLSASQDKLVTNIRQCADSMDELVNVLLELARLDASAIRPKISSFCVGSMLSQLQIQFAPVARAKNLELRIVHSSAVVRSNRMMVECMLRNLIANATRYTERGKIIVGCRRKGDKLRVTVSDTGPGIPAIEQKAVFNDYYQLEAGKRHSDEGLGLGLAIVRQLSELLSVPITVHSTPGQGTVFALDLPLLPRD